MNGFTGMDPEKAKKNIDDFFSKCMECHDYIKDTFYKFFFDLSFAWVSPNAYEFSIDIEEKFNILLWSIKEEANVISKNAYRAYNIVATAHGCTRIFRTEDNMHFRNNLSNDITSFFAKEKNGVSGVNVILVRDYILPNLEVIRINMCELLDAIPTEIALYDDENGQAQVFSTGIATLKDKVNTFVDDIISYLNTALTTEVDNALLAKQQATDAMSTNA